MPVECAFVLPGGRKCRCMATRDHRFCRHHGAPRSATPRRAPDPWSRLARWRDLGRSVSKIHKKDAVLEALGVLEALRDKRIADRTGGRLLRLLLQGWDQLPLMPTPESGWARRVQTPANAPLVPAPSQPSAPAPSAGSPLPADNEILTLEQMMYYTDLIIKKIDEGRP